MERCNLSVVQTGRVFVKHELYVLKLVQINGHLLDGQMSSTLICQMLDDKSINY